MNFLILELDLDGEEDNEEDDEEDEYLSESKPVIIQRGKKGRRRSSDSGIRVIASSTENFIYFQKPVTDRLAAGSFSR